MVFMTMHKTDLRRRVMGCWLGKAVGGTLGMPYEGMPGPLDLSFYRPVPETMIANDDLDLQILWACLLDRMDSPEVRPELFITGWRDHVEFPWDEYGVCKRNLAEGLLPPETGSFDNWFVDGMGAAIRSELWACLAPGNPQLAAAYAREDACMDHAGNGLWAEVYLAALQSAAFEESNVRKLIEQNFQFIPADSTIRQAIEHTIEWWDDSRDWQKVRGQILASYGHENFTNVTENLAFMVLGLLDGEGDFSRSICTAVNCGKDTDCTGATVGALLGIINPDAIDPRWLEPIGTSLVLSPEITGVTPPDTLEGFTDLVLDLGERLNGKPPVTAGQPSDQPTRPITVRYGYAAPSWFSLGWEFNKPIQLELPALRKTTLPGTWASWDASDFESEGLFLEFTFELSVSLEARVFFNTNENCRVFLDDEYVFGRESGRMAPSPHRVPLGQAVDCQLQAGRHTIVAVIQRPGTSKIIQWVVGVADRNDHCQWLPGVFL